MNRDFPRRVNGGVHPSGPIPATAGDRFGRPLAVGQLVMYHPAHDLVFRVKEVGPVLDPKAPPGAVQIVLEAQVPLMVPGNQPQPGLVVIGTPQEGQAAENQASTQDTAPASEMAAETALTAETPPNGVPFDM